MAQEVSLAGEIKKENSEESLPFISIAVKNSSKGTISDSNGKFTIVVQTKDTLLVSSVGFETQLIPVSTFNGVIALKESTIVLSEITINAKRKRTTKSHVGNLKGKTDYILGGSNQYAFLLKNDRNLLGTIEELYFNIQPDIDKDNRQETTLRIRLYKNDNNIPTEDLLTQNLIIKVKKNLKNLRVDLTKYSIPFYEEGVFIGLDLLGTTDDKNVFTPYNRNKAPLNLRIEFTKSNLYPTYRKHFGTKWTKVMYSDRSGKSNDISAKFGAKVAY